MKPVFHRAADLKGTAVLLLINYPVLSTREKTTHTQHTLGKLYQCIIDYPAEHTQPISEQF